MKRLLRGGAPTPESSPPSPPSGAAQAEPHARHSHGLEQFLSHLQKPDSLRVLDVGGVTQANVSFITELGHKLYAEDFLRALDACVAQGQPGAELDSGQVQAFLSQNLDFPEGHFDGVLLWDALEFLPQPLLKATIDRLFRITKHDSSSLLAFFHAEEKAESVPVYSYRISDARTLLLARREMRRPLQLFNNRGVEKLFQRFHSVKFFLARDRLREVIVRR